MEIFVIFQNIEVLLCAMCVDMSRKNCSALLCNKELILIFVLIINKAIPWITNAIGNIFLILGDIMSWLT